MGDLNSCTFVVQLLSHVRVFVTPWTVVRQTLLSMGFSRQEYWNELPFCSSGDLPNLGIESGSLALPADSLPYKPPGNYILQYRCGEFKTRLLEMVAYNCQKQRQREV